jgi:hypothetical protein
MKLVLLPALLAAITAASALAASDDVRAMRGGQAVTLANPARVADHLAADLESCTVNSTAMRPIAGAWEDTLASGSYLHAAYSPPRHMSLFTEGNRHRVRRAVDEILLPLPDGAWPKHNLARIEGKVSAFVKCDPKHLMKIILEPELALRDVRPYKSLIDAWEQSGKP